MSLKWGAEVFVTLDRSAELFLALDRCTKLLVSLDGGAKMFPSEIRSSSDTVSPIWRRKSVNIALYRRRVLWREEHVRGENEIARWV